MKKTVLLLAVCLMLGLCACGQSAQAKCLCISPPRRSDRTQPRRRSPG